MAAGTSYRFTGRQSDCSVLTLLVAVAVSLIWATDATPGVVTLTLYSDPACSTAYPTSMYNLNSFSTPDIGQSGNTAACVDINSSTSTSSSVWSQVEVGCQVYPTALSINFRAYFFANNTGCNMATDYDLVTFGQQGSTTMGLCNPNGTLFSSVAGNHTYNYHVPMKLTCIEPKSSHATRAFQLSATTAAMVFLLCTAAFALTYG